MKHLPLYLLFAAGLCLVGCKPAYQNTNLSPAERAEDLVSRMTLEEKVSQMQNTAPAIPHLGIKASLKTSCL